MEYLTSPTHGRQCLHSLNQIPESLLRRSSNPSHDQVTKDWEDTATQRWDMLPRFPVAPLVLLLLVDGAQKDQRSTPDCSAHKRKGAGSTVAQHYRYMHLCSRNAQKLGRNTLPYGSTIRSSDQASPTTALSKSWVAAGWV